jgi:hypothetical protein
VVAAAAAATASLDVWGGTGAGKQHHGVSVVCGVLYHIFTLERYSDSKGGSPYCVRLFLELWRLGAWLVMAWGCVEGRVGACAAVLCYVCAVCHGMSIPGPCVAGQGSKGCRFSASCTVTRHVLCLNAAATNY